MITQKNIQATADYIRRDHKSRPTRFWLEVVAWAMSIGGAILFALTVPAVPFVFYLIVVYSAEALDKHLEDQVVPWIGSAPKRATSSP